MYLDKSVKYAGYIAWAAIAVAVAIMVALASSCSHAILVVDCKPHHVTLDGKFVQKCTELAE